MVGIHKMEVFSVGVSLPQPFRLSAMSQHGLFEKKIIIQVSHKERVRSKFSRREWSGIVNGILVMDRLVMEFGTGVPKVLRVEAH